MNSQNIAYSLIAFITTVFLLIKGQSIIVPIILGLLLWLVIRSLRKTIDLSPFLRKYLPTWFKSVISAIIILATINGLIGVVSMNINTLSLYLQTYSFDAKKLIEEANQLLANPYFKVDIQEILAEQSFNIDFTNIFRNLFGALSGMVGDTFMIILYAIFILLEESTFYKKLSLTFTSEKQGKQYDQLLSKIEASITDYFKLKTLLSLITGVLSYIVLYFIGIETPFFWAFLIFVLNFIPTIGSLIATVFPAIFSIIQFESLPIFLTILTLVGLVQVFVGNFLEPKMMGSSMNVSPLVTIVALSFWGFIWGITGMMLSVPITVIGIIILSIFPETKNVAILLSENGKIENAE